MGEMPWTEVLWRVSYEVSLLGGGGQASEEGTHAVGAVSTGPEHSPGVGHALEAGELMESCHCLYWALGPTCNGVLASSQPWPSVMPGRFPDQQGLREPRGTCRQPGFWYKSQSQWYVFGGGTQLTVLGQPKATPTLNVFAPSQDELDTKKATLVCLLNGFYPSAVEVSWTKDGSPVSQGVNTARPSRQSDNKYSTSSFLSLSADQWLSANTFACKVSHDGKVIQKELSRSQCT
ncbi:immunoglobulin lambda-like polypeptide 5 [Notamacropus eugenii]|uniref:immunoglobulin lambda-like polypeptide 5 n=1 Tax=Notamacropus eugenii TaxID=9315 RepID=UPI003B681DC2